MTYCWPEAKAKALAAGELIRKRVRNALGADPFDEFRIETVGAGACHGPIAGEADPPEATLRVSARSRDRAACEYLGRELVPLVLTGPPGATGFAAGRPRASAVAAFWSGLIPREQVAPRVEVLEA
jgi:hypothetical protein